MAMADELAKFTFLNLDGACGTVQIIRPDDSAIVRHDGKMTYTIGDIYFICRN